MFTKLLLPNRVMSTSDRYMCLGSPFDPLQLLCGKWSWGTTKSKVTDESRDHGRWGVKMCWGRYGLHLFLLIDRLP